MAAIHLGLSLPAGSSGQPGAGPDALHPLFGLAPDGVCLAPLITDGTVSSDHAFASFLQQCDLLVFKELLQRVQHRWNGSADLILNESTFPPRSIQITRAIAGANCIA